MDLDRLTPVDKAQHARAVLDNPVFNSIVKEEIEGSTSLAVHATGEDIRCAHRYNVIWLENILARLRKVVQDANG